MNLTGLMILGLISFPEITFSQFSDPMYHVFYLHGKIVEQQGIEAEHERFGKYLYQDIIDSLSVGEVIMHHELRSSHTDFYTVGQKVVRQIDSLIQIGVKPNHIIVLGASKGGVIAMYISHLSLHPIKYVLLGANNAFIEQQNDWQLHGNILAIVEASDQVAGRGFHYWKKCSPQATIQELTISTGLGHGFLYQPLAEWLLPTRDWIASAQGY